MGLDISLKLGPLEFENPFIIASGPPGTNKATIAKAFAEGWGGVVAKTISLDNSKVKNVSPRYGKLYSRGNGEVIGFQNIELISDRPFNQWLNDFADIKVRYPHRVLLASVMEEYDKSRWTQIVRDCDAAGVDGFELNLSCPHGLPERKMGAAMGQSPELVAEVMGWVRAATKKPVWTKMTPNITDIRFPALSALKAGADGVSMINTILCIIGVDLKTLRPMPTVSGYSTPGGYSAAAVLPIALKMIAETRKAMVPDFGDRTLSGIGGVECAEDAIQHILLGADTVQACTAPMLQGFAMIKKLIEDLNQFMSTHGFTKLSDFKGHSLQYLTSYNELSARFMGHTELASDESWRGDQISDQTKKISSN